MLEVNSKKLILILANKEISSLELSQISGISQTTLARFKAGTQKARPTTVGKLARALGVKVEDLI